jgi:hypothetical protein
VGPHVLADRSDVGFGLGNYVTSLHLGFEPTPYPGGDTADKIARILEAEYGIVQHFLTLHKDTISELIHQALADSLETGEIELTSVEKLFHQFLDSGEIERLGIPGTPTEASKKKTKVGTHIRRGKWVSGYTRRQRARASFVKTGTYRDSFRAWIEVDDNDR